LVDSIFIGCLIVNSLVGRLNLYWLVNSIFIGCLIVNSLVGWFSRYWLFFKLC